MKDKKEQAGTLTIISDKQVERSTKTDLVNIISDNVSSFYTGSRGMMGYGVARNGSAVMSIRGIGVSGWGPATGIPFLINGTDTTMPLMGHPVADIFTMRNIDRIEVLHGPQPVLFGSGAMGGLVNIITRRQQVDGFRTELSGSYGSFNSTDDYIMHQGKFGIFDYGASYGFQRTSGDRDQNILGHTYTSEYQSSNGTARFGMEIGKYLYADINSYLMKEKINDPGPVKSTSGDPEVFDIIRGGFALNMRNTFDLLEGSLQAYYNRGEHKSVQPRQDISTWKSTDVYCGAKLMESAKLFEGNKLTLGLEVKRYGGTAKNPDNGSYYINDKFMTDKSFFAMDEQKIFKMILLSAGGRLTDDSDFGTYRAAQAGIIVNPMRNMKLHASAARGFKLPGLRELYLKMFPAEVPNPDLKPETNLTCEAGVDQTLFDSLTLGITGYRIYSDNKIAKLGPGWTNLDEFNYKGLEMNLKYSFEETAGVQAGYSYIDNKYKGQRINYVPSHKLLFGCYGEMYKVYAGLNAEYAKDVWYDYSAGKKLDNYFLLNARLAYSFLGNYKAFVNFNNITDKTYETYYGYPMPGFNVMGGLSAVF